ncbi:NUDIX domain-containing protein [Candidatus Nomurabacteria bacterium]|nr:NUDIX domain-containing protein [Candidatus Nomurabacteria bacterium]
MNDQQDLTILLENTVLKIRVAILLETPSGFVFEKSKDGYMFLLGGTVKLNETTQETASREIFEELKLKNIDTKMIAVIENFFKAADGKRIHEINFVYKATLPQPLDLSIFTSDNGNLGYCYIKVDDFGKHDIRPKIIKEFLKNKKSFVHLINCE